MNANLPLKKRSPFKFFVLIFVLSLPFWLLGTVLKNLPLPVNLPISALQAVCPLIAAIILVSQEKQPGGVKKLLKRAFDANRIKQRLWYAPIILLNPLIMVISYGVMRLLGRPLPADPFIPFLLLLPFFAVFFLAALCEEVGWMGYAVDPLQERRNAFTTSLILGVIWAIWHLIPWLSTNSPMWVAGQFASTIGLRLLIVWLYNNTGRSVFAAIVFHAMINVSEFSFPNYGSHYDPIISAIITVVLALIITFLWGPKTLARFRYRNRQSGEI